jgi:hypothetical protein
VGYLTISAFRKGSWQILSAILEFSLAFFQKPPRFFLGNRLLLLERFR